MKNTRLPIVNLLILISYFTFISCSKDDDASVDEQPVDAQISSLDGQIQFLEIPPASLELDELVSDTLIFIFAEKRNHTLTQNIETDLSVPGDYFPDSVPDDQQTWEALIPGTIYSGTKVHSYYLHYDNKTYNDTFNLSNYLNCIGQYQVNAEIRFKSPVLGIVMRAGLGSEDHLGNSNQELGVSTVDYCDDNLSHFPGINIADGCQSDRFILSEDRMTLTVKNNSDIHHDNYRVILAAD